MALLTVEDLEKDSQVSRFTWRTWIAEGRIRAVRLGRRVRVDQADYTAFKEANARLGARPASTNGTTPAPKKVTSLPKPPAKKAPKRRGKARG